MNRPYFFYILNTSGINLFTYNFRKEFEQFQEQLFSGFIAAISKFTDELKQHLKYGEREQKLTSIPIGKNFLILLIIANLKMPNPYWVLVKVCKIK